MEAASMTDFPRLRCWKQSLALIERPESDLVLRDVRSDKVKGSELIQKMSIHSFSSFPTG